MSYLIPILMRITFSRYTFEKNVFHLGRLSIVFGSISAVWLSFSSVILFLPNEKDPIRGYTWDNFNFTPVVVGIVLVFMAIYWNLPKPRGAKHFYHGPKHPDYDRF